MNFWTILKLVGATLIQIEVSPFLWKQAGFSQAQIYIIVINLAFIMVMINISLIKLGVYLLGVRKSKPKLGQKIAQVIHTWGIPGLLVVGLIPWPPIIGIVQPLTYLLYCKAEKRAWYKPNLGLLSLFLGVSIKMYLII